MLGIGVSLTGWALIVLAVGAVVVSGLGVWRGEWGPGLPIHRAAMVASPQPQGPTPPAIRPLPDEPAADRRWAPLLMAASVAFPLLCGGLALKTLGRHLVRG